VTDPEKWYTTEQILNHDWLADAEDYLPEVFTETEKERIKWDFCYKDTTALNWNTKPEFEHS